MKNCAEKIYSIIDSFLVEAGERSIEHLNEDRHLAYKELKEYIESMLKDIVGEEMELNWKDNIVGEANKQGYEFKRKEIINKASKYGFNIIV